MSDKEKSENQTIVKVLKNKQPNRQMTQQKVREDIAHYIKSYTVKNYSIETINKEHLGLWFIYPKESMVITELEGLLAHIDNIDSNINCNLTTDTIGHICIEVKW